MERHVLSSVFVSCMLMACAPIRVDVSPDVSIPEKFEHAKPKSRVIELSRWWRDWPDPVLTMLIEQGLGNNRDLKSALSNLNAARSQAALARADLWPQVSANGQGILMQGQANPIPEATRASAAAIGIPSAAQAHFNRPGYRSVDLSVSWEPDIFGDKASDAEVAKQSFLAENERWHGAQMLVASDIADHYVQARALQILIGHGRERLAILNRMKKYVQARFEAGQLGANDVEQTRVQLSADRASLATLNAEFAAHVRSIAVLTGHVPQGFTLAESSVSVFDVIPLEPPDGERPMDILMRRPDVRANERLVMAHNAQLASAMADRMPRLNIKFMWQRGHVGLDTSIPGYGVTGGLLSAGVTIPIFTAGRIARNIDTADSRLKAAVARYEHSVLNALAEIDSSYQLQFALHRQSLLLEQAMSQAGKHASLTERLFRLGEVTLDRSMDAHLQVARLKENETRVRLAEARNMLALYKALGGGWEQ